MCPDHSGISPVREVPHHLWTICSRVQSLHREVLPPVQVDLPGHQFLPVSLVLLPGPTVKSQALSVLSHPVSIPIPVSITSPSPSHSVTPHPIPIPSLHPSHSQPLPFYPSISPLIPIPPHPYSILIPIHPHPCMRTTAPALKSPVPSNLQCHSQRPIQAPSPIPISDWDCSPPAAGDTPHPVFHSHSSITPSHGSHSWCCPPARTLPEPPQRIHVQHSGFYSIYWHSPEKGPTPSIPPAPPGLGNKELPSHGPGRCPHPHTEQGSQKMVSIWRGREEKV